MGRDPHTMTREELIAEVLEHRSKRSTESTIPPPPKPHSEQFDAALASLKTMFKQRNVDCLTANIGRKDGNLVWIVSIYGPKGLTSMAVLLGQKEPFAPETLREVVNRSIRHVFRDSAKS